jgi:hypothetical protein
MHLAGALEQPVRIRPDDPRRPIDDFEGAGDRRQDRLPQFERDVAYLRRILSQEVGDPLLLLRWSSLLRFCVF